MLRIIAKLAAWAALAAIVLLALTPQGSILVYPTNFIDRAFRYAVLSLLWVTAYPRNLPAVIIILVCVAVGSEAAELLLPGKSARAVDLLSKLAGTAAGITIGVGVLLGLSGLAKRRKQ